jgi:hypothetical protein
MVAGLAERAEVDTRGQRRSMWIHMLKITNDGQKLALDIGHESIGGKTTKTTRPLSAPRCLRIWAGQIVSSAQLVFCDVSTPGKSKPIEMQEANGSTK